MNSCTRNVYEGGTKPRRERREQGLLLTRLLTSLFLFLLFLFPRSLALAQAPNAATISFGPVLTPYTTIAANVPYRVCPLSATGVPCSTIGASLFSDPNLTQPLPNPTSTSAQGLVNFFIAANAYQLQLTPVPGVTYVYFFILNTGGSGSGGPLIQTNTVNNFSQILLNFTDTSTIAFTNPSGGVESATCKTATSSALGCSRPDNTTITIAGGVLTATGVASFQTQNLSPLFTATPLSPTTGAVSQTFTIASAPNLNVIGNVSGGSGPLVDVTLQAGTGMNFTFPGGNTLTLNSTGTITNFRSQGTLLAGAFQPVSGFQTWDYDPVAITPDSGYQNALMKTNTVTGKLDFEVPVTSSTAGIQMSALGLATGNHFVLYPSSCTATPDPSGNGVAVCAATGPSGTQGSGFLTCGPGGSVGPSCSVGDVWNFTLPAGVNQANILSVYAIAITQFNLNQPALGGYMACGTSGSFSAANGTQSSFHFPSVPTINTLTCTDTLGRSLASPYWSSETTAQVALVIYDNTDTLPATPNNINVVPPLYTYTNSGATFLGLNWPYAVAFDFGATNAMLANVPLPDFQGSPVNVPPDGMELVLIPAHTTTATPTLALNGQLANNITLPGGTATPALTVGNRYLIIFNGASTRWEVQNPSVPLSGSGTGGFLTQWTGSGTSYALGNSPLDFGVTNAGVVTSTSPIAIAGSRQGSLFLGVGSGTIPNPVATNWAAWFGATSGTSTNGYQMPSAAPSSASVMVFSTASLINGQQQSSNSWLATSAIGTVSDGAGTTTAGIIPESTTSAHVLDYNSNLSIIGGVLTYAGPGGVSITGTTHGVTIPAGTAVAGAAGKVVYASDATNGYAEANENNTGLSRFCTVLNGQCASLTASLTTTAATSDNVTVTGMVAAGHCALFQTNASAATNIATTYVSAKTTNQITVTHVATSGMTFDVLCTVN